MIQLEEVIEILDGPQVEKIKQALTKKILEIIDELPEEELEAVILDSVRASLDDYDFSPFFADLGEEVTRFLVRKLRKSLE